VTVARRLATLEGELDPTQRVMAWLAEAHAYDSFENYLGAVIDADPSQMPMDRLPREAAAVAPGQRHSTARDRDDAVHRAICDVVLRVHLVLRIVDVTDSVTRREELVVALLTAHVALTLTRENEPGGCLPLVQLRDLFLGRVAELLAQEEARKLVEARYLGGHVSLFPATQRRWQALVHEAQTAAVMTLRLAELDGADPIDEERQLLPDPARIEACIADFVEVARIKTLDDVGEGHAAVDRLRRWLGSASTR
jgi:hypothetical protein